MLLKRFFIVYIYLCIYLSFLASVLHNNICQCSAYTDDEQRADCDPNYGPSADPAV